MSRTVEPVPANGVRLDRYRWVLPEAGISAKCDLSSAMLHTALHGGWVEHSWAIAYPGGGLKLSRWTRLDDQVSSDPHEPANA